MSNDTTLEDRIEEVEAIEGDGTELVTLAIPPDRSLRDIYDRITDEIAGADQIKADRTRSRVRKALKRVRRHLLSYPTLPEMGLIIYAGFDGEEIYSTVFDDLPGPVDSFVYRCDSSFETAPLRAVTGASTRVGLVVVERGRAAVGSLVDERVLTHRTLESQVQGKTRAGGQSAQRFARERERQLDQFFTSVGNAAAAAFEDGLELRAVAIGGTMVTAKEFARGEYLPASVASHVLGTYSVEYATEQGLVELSRKASADMASEERQERAEIMEELFTRIRDGNRATYGIQDVRQAAEYGAVETLLVAGNRDLDLEELVESYGGRVVEVPVESGRGKQFAQGFGGIGALLRFPVN